MIQKTLSIFIDESDDFGTYDHHAPFYLITMILHNQNMDISKGIRVWEDHLQNLGYEPHAIHTGPLIRRESIYLYEQMENRKKLFHALFHFARRLDFNYLCASIRKSECPDIVTMTAKLARNIADMLQDHMEYLKALIIFVRLNRLTINYFR